ncbi:MAG: hypothetical protein ACTSVC_09635 [Promethearchaeota archaeon]
MGLNISISELYKLIDEAIDRKMKDIKVTREAFDKLSEKVDTLIEITRELAQAQQRTEDRIGELAQAQQRTEDRIGESAQVQQRTEDRIGELAQAQQRTEDRIGELVQAQQRTEDRIGELAQAQQRTEESVKVLANAITILSQGVDRLEEGQKELKKEIGKLSQNIGYGLEDVCRVVVPPYLERHYNIILKGMLDRKFFQVEDKQIEIDFYAEGKRNDEDVVVIGESKARMYVSDLSKFLKNIEMIKEQLKNKNVILFIFGYVIYPKVQEMAKEKGIIVIFSYSK